MPPRRRRATQKGEGFFDVLSGVAKAGMGALKDSKMVSSGLSSMNNPLAKAAGGIAGALGWGRPRKRKATTTKRRTTQKGEGFMDFLKAGMGALKDSKMVSSGLSTMNNPIAKAAGGIAGALGWGRPRKMKGGAIMPQYRPKPMVMPVLVTAKGAGKRKRKSTTAVMRGGGKTTMTVL